MIINIWRARALPELNVKAPKTRISGVLIYPVFFSVTDILRRILMKKKSTRNVNFLVRLKVISMQANWYKTNIATKQKATGMGFFRSMNVMTYKTK